MPEYTPRELFADWYKSADIGMDEKILKMRLESIDKAIKNNDDNFWLEIVRLYLQLPTKDETQKKSFIAYFKEVDPTFPLENNEAILRTLAASTLCFNITEEDENNYIICLSVLVGNFFSSQAINQRIPVMMYANKYIQENFRSNREDNIDIDEAEKLVGKINKAETLVKEDVQQEFSIVNDLLQSHLNLKDEVNVLWWLLGEHSNTTKKSFKETTAKSMTLIAPFELSNQTNFSRGFISADAFLNRSLTIANGGKGFKEDMAISDIIISLSTEERKALVPNGNISDLTPALLGVKNSLDTTTSEVWAKENETWLNKKFKPVDLAHHVYYEYLLLNLL